MRKTIALILVAFFMTVGVAMAEVNVNTATKAELVELPGIGAVKADAIIDYRETNGNFATLSELAEVNGIGDATVADLKGKAGIGEAK